MTTSAERQNRRRNRLNEIAQNAGYQTWGKYETETIKKGQITMEPVFKVTNDYYSREIVSGTWDQLQVCFDNMGWNVKLAYERGRLIDTVTGEEVGIKIS